jgi:hypothetical protein
MPSVVLLFTLRELGSSPDGDVNAWRSRLKPGTLELAAGAWAFRKMSRHIAEDGK